MPTFLHAADLHLDSPLRGLDAREGAPAERIRKASRIALERMVDAALERGVDFVLLAGDIYDTRPAFETYLFFHGQMARLSEWWQAAIRELLAEERVSQEGKGRGTRYQLVR